MIEMSDYDVSNFRQQSKFTQLIFEDFMMIALNSLIIAGIL